LNDNEKLKSISAYYNRVNHFVAIKPPWSTNILGAGNVWEAMGKPKNPKEPSLAGTQSNMKKKDDDKANLVKFKVMQLGQVNLNI